MKTPAFVPLVLFIILVIGYALGAEPAPSKAQKARVEAVAKETPCPRCLYQPMSYHSYRLETNMMAEVNGKYEPVGKWEYYGLKCPKCAKHFRIWKELVATPKPTSPTLRLTPPMPPGLPTRSPPDPR